MNSFESFLQAYPWLPLAIFFLWWCFVVWLVGKISGWQELAEKYPGGSQLDDPMVRWKWWQSVSMRAHCNYNNCLILGISPKGLALRMPFVFRVGHPPILLPWQAIESAEAGQTWWIKTLRLQVGSPRISLLFAASALEGAEAWLRIQPKPAKR